MDKYEPLIKSLVSVKPAAGELTWIGIRPGREETVQSVDAVEVSLENGLAGDHYQGRAQGERQVTLIQAEHLDAVASFLGKEAIGPEQVRRNLVVRGLNLYALRNRRIRIGEVVVEGTGLCHPCSRMEKVLGPGGYNAMRGHGGLTARVVEAGTIRTGDSVEAVEMVSEVADSQ